MKRFCIFLIYLCFSNFTYSQKAFIKKIFSNEKDTTRSATFLPIPVFGYAQETGFEFGLGSIYSFYVDKNDIKNWSSNFTASASYSTKKSYNVKLKGDIWTKNNSSHIISELRFKNLPFNFYGTGNNTSAFDEDKLQQSLTKVSIDFEKKIAHHTYSGVSLGFENYTFKDLIPLGIFDYDNSIVGKNGGKLLLIGLSQSFDTRNSNNYPTQGFYGRLSFQYAPNLFGTSNFNGSIIKLNARNFWSLNDKLVLAWQAIFYSTQGGQIPFYLLPQLGNDEMMRGYYTGRYREQNLIATQAEFRYRFLERIGIVAFVGGGKVFKNGQSVLRDLKPNYGIGGRFFFDPAKGLSLRLDYGVGEKLSFEKRQKGFYISFAEAF